MKTTGDMGQGSWKTVRSMPLDDFCRGVLSCHLFRVPILELSGMTRSYFDQPQSLPKLMDTTGLSCGKMPTAVRICCSFQGLDLEFPSFILLCLAKLASRSLLLMACVNAMTRAPSIVKGYHCHIGRVRRIRQEFRPSCGT